MGWSVGYDEIWKRFIGYGVVAYCDHPDCNEEIDRGLSYVCGGEPYGGDRGCGLYFCEEHLYYHYHDNTVLCERCFYGEKLFNPKPEHPEWIKHMLTDKSWAKWRKENKDGVKILKHTLKMKRKENKRRLI